jgi:predicted enzyme related to lactoylglutathione lyase
MPTRTEAPIGAPCWVDLSTTDVDAARAFYPGLLGWTALESSPEFGGYFMFARDGKPTAGGMAAMPGQPGPGAWTVYLASDNAQKTVDLAVEAGAQVLVAPMPVADLGTMAVLQDPTGAVVGVWQPGSFPGFLVLGEPGTPGWFELLTRDYDRAVAFYRDVFGWDVHVMSDTPEFRYTTQGEGDGATAGILDASSLLAGGESARWQTYLVVEDADAAVDRAASLGGRVVRPAEDTPYGRIGAVADPSGVPVYLMGPVTS